MLIEGVREWFGEDGRIFLQLRNSIENYLLNNKFEYFHGGVVSRKEIYENNVSILGRHFMKNCIEFDINGKNKGNIIAPEGTFRVYDYLSRNNKIENNSGKVFYSQEFVRNESQQDVKEGKTISFWQTGFEIYGKKELESSILALKTLISCFRCINLSEVYFRISDKRILEGLIINLPLKSRREIYNLIDECKEDGDLFKESYIRQGGDLSTAEKVGKLLKIRDNGRTTLDIMDYFTDNSLSHSGVEFIKKILDEIHKENLNVNIKVIPFMPKSWDACDSLLFDARLPNYAYAVAGGGNLLAFNKDKKVMKSGAGIGVTRLTEYFVRNKEAVGL